MSKLYKIPGVYTEEISIPPSITAVETAIPVFIGYTPKARQYKVDDLAFVPTRIKSMQEYEQYFGTLVSETIAANILDEVKIAESATTLISRKITIKVAFLRNMMHYQLQLYFANGGGPCYIVSVGRPKLLLNKKELGKGLDEAYLCDEPTLIIFADGVNLTKATDLYSLYNDALMQACELKDRFVLMDVSNNDLHGKTAIELFRDSITGGENPGSLKYGAAYYPLLHTTIPYNYSDSFVKTNHHIVIKEQGKPDVNSKGEFDGFSLNNLKTTNPVVYALVKEEIAKYTITLPASAAVAGVFANTDATRGVWKAPANLDLSHVKAPNITLNDQDQLLLNVDTGSGKSINAIRYFIGRGTMLWGARTLAGNDNEWRYISVRRFFNMVEESIKKAIGAFVFDPNDANTWAKVKGMIDNFLTVQWRAGALAGAKPEHAFFVKIGLGQTMTSQDILDGLLITEIGMAPVRPSEFIIIRLIHHMQQH